MQFALLGYHQDLDPLLTAIAASADHHLTAVAEGDAEFQDRFPALHDSAKAIDWESLLIDSSVQAVIVGRATTPESLQQLAGAGVALLVRHPACTAIETLHLEMIRESEGGRLLPYSPGLLHPAVAELRTLCSQPDSPLGAIEQLTLERNLPSPNREEILGQLATDALLIRTITGEVDRVSAMGNAESLANLNVTLDSQDTLARWSLRPTGSGAVLRVIGTAGEAALTMADEEQRWELAIGEEPPRSYAEYQPGAAYLDWMADPQQVNSPTWMEACRATEIAELSTESLRRGRAIPIRNERPTEQDTFKGMMSALGCGFLLFTLALFLFAMVVSAVSSPFSDGGSWFERMQMSLFGSSIAFNALLWRFWILLLALFLLLQLLLFVFKKPDSANNIAIEDSSDLAG